MKWHSMNRRRQQKEQLTSVLGRIFPGLNGREIAKEIKDAFSWNQAGRSYRSRRPVNQDVRPVPFNQ